MKHYRITEIKDEDTIYRIDPISGMYKNNNGTLKHPNVLICNPNFKIHAIKDNERDIEFRVGELITIPTPWKLEVLGNIESISYITVDNYHYDVVLGARSKGGYLNYSIKECDMLKPELPVKKTKVKKAEVVEEQVNENLQVVRKLEAKIMSNFKSRVLKFGTDAEGNKFIRKKTESKHEFMENFFERNNKYNTIHVDDGGEQTSRARRRSLGDIYMILKYYYPKCTLESIIPYLYGDNKLKTRTQFCNATQKRVFRALTQYENPKDYSLDHEDEYGHNQAFYKKAIEV